MKNKAIKFLLKLSISGAFVAWLILKTEWSEVFLHAQKISVFHIILYVVVLLCGMLISAWKWKVLLAHKEIGISLKKSFELYLTGAFINNFMPSTIGGDTYRAYQIGKKSGKYAAVTSSVVFDRFTGLFAVMLLTGVMALFQWGEISEHPQLKSVVIAVLLLMHAVIFLGILSRFLFWKKISRKLPEFVQKFGLEFLHFRKNKTYLKAIAISVLFSLVGLALVNGILFWGLGVRVGIMQYLSVIFLISIITSLPISINNIGVKEWAYVTFFGFFGVSASAVVTVALVSRVLQMLVSFTALPIYLKQRR